MKKQGLAFIALVFTVGIFSLSSCKKINEATELGSDLIPPIDNVNTFDTTLSVETVNHLFTSLEDTTASTATQFFGTIGNDPLFGKTEASMYFQLVPQTIKKPFPFAKDSLVGLDSVVLVLNTPTVWGDTITPQQVQVFEIPTTQSFNHTDKYLISKQYINSLGPALSGVHSFVPSTLNDSIVLQKERVANQLRIPLNNSLGTRFLSYDSTNAFASNAAFKSFFNGIAVVPQNNGGANALVGVNLVGTTSLSFYVRYKNAGKIDTTAVRFLLTDSAAVANYIKRDYSGSELATAVTGADPDETVYLQSTPGAYATVKIPALGGLNNRVVHLAELVVEQVYDPLSPLLTPPTYLYVDAFDATKNRYRTIPFDVLLNPIGDPLSGFIDNDTVSYDFVNPNEFGMAGKKTTDAGGNSINTWRFNLTRYVQRVVNKMEPAEDLRLYSPMPILRSLSNGIEQWLISRQYQAIGRVRVGGGNHPTQRMRLRIVYSKL